MNMNFGNRQGDVVNICEIHTWHRAKSQTQVPGWDTRGVKKDLPSEMLKEKINMHKIIPLKGWQMQ